jgi:aryl-alcohol dehydrogenase-like predicted oxidoreductase
MNYVRLGKTGLKISRLALGCMSYGDPTTANAHTWALNEDDAQPYFRQAVEMGITFWDTANTYQAGTSEEVVGRAIQRYSRREDIVLATTVFGKMHDGSGGQGLSRKAILEQVDGSLTRLAPTTSTSTRSTASTPRLQSQRPWRPSTTSSRPGRSATPAPPPCMPGSSPNFNTPPNFTAGPRSCRCKISTTCYGGKMNGSCCPCAPTWASAPSAVFPSGQRTPGSSLGRTVKAFQRGQGCPVLRLTLDEPVVNAVQSVAESRGATMARVALGWVLASSFVSAPIVGATKPHHLPEAVAALDLHLSEDELHSLEEPYTPQGRSWFQETVTHRRGTAQ